MYSIYLSQNGDILQLPLAPEKLRIKIGDKNKTVDLLNQGEVLLLKDPGLKEMELEFELPGFDSPIYSFPRGFMPPSVFIEKFEAWKFSKKPIRLVINRAMPNGSPIFDTNLQVGFGEISVEEKGGDVGTFNISIPCKEWKDYMSRTLEVTHVDGNRVIARKETQRPSKPKPTSYIVQQGQNLWQIAKSVLDDESKIEEIMKLNNIDDPFKIPPGTNLRLGD